MDSTLSFYLLILLLLSTLTLVSSQSQYVLPDHHFINCGSNSDIDFTGKKFVGDENADNFSVSGGRTTRNNNNPASTIGGTARVFTTKSWYELQAEENNTFMMLRLHFFPFFFNGIELFSSKFNVSVSGFTLLSNFNVGETTVMRDFIIPIRPERKFRIEFTPSSNASPAFVNAIEAFTTPSELFGQGASSPVISPAGKTGDMNNISSSYAFNPIYRVNVGGQRIDVDRDTLRRIWTPDDPFIFINKGSAGNITTDALNFNGMGAATKYDAPEDVYRTAKQLNDPLANITWNFGVKKNTMYLIRAHFCDIGEDFSSPNNAFNFFIYSHYKKEIQPGNRVFTAGTPFYEDFVVDSIESGSVNISIGVIRGNSQQAFLNGLEIMELLSRSGVVVGKKRKKLYTVVGCVVAGVTFVLFLLISFFIVLKYRKANPIAEKKRESNVVPSYGRCSFTSININFAVNQPSPILHLNLNLRFPFIDILNATNSFNESLVIGKGGFGKVYKGTLSNGIKVAVKRGEKGHGQGRPEFVTEIMVLSKIRHSHLVNMIGYCDERSEMILVYEFMHKGNLQDHLYANKDHPKLSWIQRLEICISATRGLHYLHTGSDAGIIHRDVKSTNILINENYVAKVADFGISRLENVEESEISYIKGSFGYLDPEYIRCMKLTKKSDVYSFGVVLLEVLCARPALDNTRPQKEANLADWAIREIKDGKVDTIIDPFLVGTISPNSLRKFLETTERCLKEKGDDRPNMMDVLWDLEYALKLQQMVMDNEPFGESTVNTSLPMPMIRCLPPRVNEDSDVINDSSNSSYHR